MDFSNLSVLSNFARWASSSQLKKQDKRFFKVKLYTIRSETKNQKREREKREREKREKERERERERKKD